MKKFMYLIFLTVIPLSLYSQENISFKNSKLNSIKFKISQEVAFVKFPINKKDNIANRLNDVKYISNDRAFVKLDTEHANSRESIKALKAKINEEGVDILPVLIYEDGVEQVCDNEISIKLKNSFLLDKLFPKYKYIVTVDKFVENSYLLKFKNIDIFQIFDLVNQLQTHPDIEYIEPNFIRFTKPLTNDTHYASQWSIDNQGYSGGTPDADMDVDLAWKFTKGDGVKIAVLDEGVDLTHDDLTVNLLPGYDAVRGKSKGAPDYNNSHGTLCAGVISAFGNNGRGIAGIAYYSKIIPVKIAYSFFDGFKKILVQDDGDTADGFYWAVKNGAKILSNSWGGGSSSDKINAAIKNAVEQDCIVLFATGNSDSNIIAYPANLDNTIAIGASTMCNDRRKSKLSCDGEDWWGSSYGKELDVVAPGVKIYTTDISGFSGDTEGDYRSDFNGTSAACPNVAGVVALMLSADPTLDQYGIIKYLSLTADKPAAYTYSNNSEHQFGDWNEEVGYGRVNAHKAVLKALNVHVSGPNRVCGLDKVYTLENIPKNADVHPVWTKSDNLYEVGGQGTTTYTVRGGALGGGERGAGWVQADISGAIFRKEIHWVNEPAVELELESNTNYVTAYLVGANGTNLAYQGLSSPPIWEVINDDQGECPANLHVSANGLVGYANGNCIDWQIEVKIHVTNGCGTTILHRIISPRAIECDDDLRISQNPMQEGNSTNRIIIDPCEDDENGRVNGREDYTVSIYTQYGEQVYFKTQKETDFDISHLPKGFYIARLRTRKGNIVSKKFIIE